MGLQVFLIGTWIENRKKESMEPGLVFGGMQCWEHVNDQLRILN